MRRVQLLHWSYLVWVDTEQMKGATVDTMALAVEGSAVVLIGVSRAYKESSNCRMEAQYALQKKKPLIPLMLTHGYEADGWLGLLLGTSMCYGFYGETLSSTSGFDARMDALCREVGGRGRADTSAATVSLHEAASEVEAEHVSERSDAATVRTDLDAELQAMGMRDLIRLAREAQVSEDAFFDSQDTDDPKAALIALLVEARSDTATTARSALRTELEGMRMRELVARARECGIDHEALLDAQDSEQPKAAILELVLRHAFP